MNKQGGHYPSVAGKLFLTTALGFALWQTAPIVIQSRHELEWGVYAWGVGGLAFLAGAGATVRDLGQGITAAMRTFRAYRPAPTDNASSWLTTREARKAGLTSSGGLFIGILDGQPVFAREFVHCLCLAPSRTGKTSSLIMPAMLHDPDCSRIVTNFNGDLTEQCGESIRAQGHELIELDPGHLTDEMSGAYNPLDVIVHDLAHAPQDALADCRSLSEVLHPGPAHGHGDPFWTSGTRKYLTFGIAAVLCASGCARSQSAQRLFEAKR